jgi:hypothetical protein
LAAKADLGCAYKNAFVVFAWLEIRGRRRFQAASPEKNQPTLRRFYRRYTSMFIIKHVIPAKAGIQ